MIGRLVLVVGSSGAGKDSILRFAMKKFSSDTRFVFPRRCITRDADIAAEDHDCLDKAAFDELAANGVFALVWQAHGNSYGVRRSIDDDLRLGNVVIVNVSRTILADAAKTYPTAVVVEITAASETRANRIAARGRESTPDILSRLIREVPMPATKLQVHTIRNDGALIESGNAFCDLITPFALGPHPR